MKKEKYLASTVIVSKDDDLPLPEGHVSIEDCSICEWSSEELKTLESYGAYYDEKYLKSPVNFIFDKDGIHVAEAKSRRVESLDEFYNFCKSDHPIIYAARSYRVKYDEDTIKTYYLFRIFETKEDFDFNLNLTLCECFLYIEKKIADDEVLIGVEEKQKIIKDIYKLLKIS